MSFPALVCHPPGLAARQTKDSQSSPNWWSRVQMQMRCLWKFIKFFRNLHQNRRSKRVSQPVCNARESRMQSQQLDTAIADGAHCLYCHRHLWRSCAQSTEPPSPLSSTERISLNFLSPRFRDDVGSDDISIYNDDITAIWQRIVCNTCFADE